MYIEEELTFSEFASKFLNINNFENAQIIDINDLNIEILSYNNKNNKQEYQKINKFIIKDKVNEYYTDGFLKGTKNHYIIEGEKNIPLKNHKDFKKINDEMFVVDIEVNNNHNYYANGRLNHNSIVGGVAQIFYSSVVVRTKKAAKIKVKRGDKEEIIGVYNKAKTEKNRCGPPLRECEFPIYFDRGIDDDASLFNEFLLRKYIVIPKDASTVYFDLSYSYFNSPETIRSMWSEERINKLIEVLKEHKLIKKDFKTLPAKDDLKNFVPLQTLAFSKDNWREIFPLIKEFYLNILTEAMQLQYMRHNVNESTDIIISKDNDEID